jgi:hypothetical protein
LDWVDVDFTATGFWAAVTFTTFFVFSFGAAVVTLALEELESTESAGVRAESLEEPQAPSANIAAIPKMTVPKAVRVERLVRAPRAMSSFLPCW